MAAQHASEPLAQQVAPESMIEEVEGWLWQQNTNGAWVQLYFILDPDGILLGFDRYPEEGFFSFLFHLFSRPFPLLIHQK